MSEDWRAEDAERRLEGRRVTLSGKPPEQPEHSGTPGALRRDGMHEDYWILSDEERAKGFVRPVRLSYKHLRCGAVTSMNRKIAETYARDPKFYSSTFCAGDRCRTYFPVGEHGEFVWDGTGEKVGT